MKLGKVHHKRFSDWDPATRTKLRAATFGPIRGGMYGSANLVDNPDTFVILDAKRNIVGWALVSKTWFNNKNTAMFFTQPHFRRQGVGRKIAAKLKKHFPDAYTVGWNETASKFFFSVGFSPSH